MSAANDFGQLIRQRRRALDLTQEQLAARVGCAVSTLRKLESGALRPSRALAARLARVLELPAAEQSAFVRLARQLPADDITRAGPVAAALPSAAETLPEPLAAAPADWTGQTVRGYRLLESLGRGGGGEVYRAQHPAVQREVAIKRILPGLAAQTQFIRRFFAEAQTVARLEHPQIVPLYDYWRDPDGACLVMRYLRGGSLADRLRAGRPEPQLALGWLQQVAAALDYAHAHGVVHRDVKPANVLLDAADRAYLADFGVAHGPDDATDEPGAIVGSPYYLAPEQIRAEPVTPQTDVYALGLLAYELLSGRRAFAELPTPELLRCHLHEPLPPLPDDQPVLDVVLRRATAKDPAERSASAGALVAALQAALDSSVVAPAAVSAPNPYCGLAAFAEEDSARFFGRAALVHRLLERLAAETPDARFLAVVGPSGSGKSSLVRAGLLPALRAGALPHSEHWLVTTLLPGAEPLAALAAALLQVAPAPDSQLAERLAADPAALSAAVHALLPADPRTELVLLVDQFEELFTLAPPEQRVAFLHALAAALAAPDPRLWLIVTLRADFYDRPLLEPSVGALFRDRTEPVTPLTSAELREVITQPALLAGATVEPALVDQLLADTAAQPGALPQLQFVLTELYDRRVGAILALEPYRALAGLGGALARRADELYAQTPAAQQDAVRQLFLQLATPGDEPTFTRRRAPLSAVDQQIAERYAAARLLTLDHDPASRAPTVEIAHEALISAWGRLRGWLDAAREALQAARRLRLSAIEWEGARRDPSFLAAGARLEQFSALAAGDLALGELEQAYVQASAQADAAARAELAAQQQADARARRERERLEIQHAADARSRVRLRWSLAVVLIALLLASGLAVVTYQQQQVAQSARQAADQSAQAATLLARAGDALTPSERPLEQTLLLARAGAALGEPYPPLVRAAVAHAYTSAPLRQLLPAQVDALAALAVSPDGGQIASLGADGKLVRVTRADGAAQAVQAHAGGARTLGWSSDGQQLLTAAADGVRLWRASDLTLLLDLPLSGVTGAALSPGGSRILLLQADGALTVLAASSGAPELVLGTHPGLRAAAWSADGALVASGGGDAVVRVWDAIAGGQLAALTGHGNDVLALAWSPDNTRLASGGADRATLVWRWGSAPQLERGLDAAGGAVQTLAFSADGTQLAAGSADGAVYLFDPATSAPRLRLAGHSGGVIALAWGPGDLLISGEASGAARVWRLGTGGRAALPRHGGAVSGVSFSPDGGRVATAGTDGLIQITDLRGTARPITLRSPAGLVNALAWSPDGAWLASADVDGALRLWAAADGRSGAVMRGHQGAATAVAWSADSKQLLSGGADGTSRVWDISSGQQFRAFDNGTSGVVAVAFSPDGTRLLTGNRDGVARLWDAQSGELLHALGQGAGPTWSALWTPDGAQVIVNGGPLTIWRAADGAALPLPNQALGAAGRVALSADGARLLAARQDNSLDVWDLARGEPQLRLAGSGALITVAAWRADGRAVITGDARGVARVWVVDPRSMVAELDRRLCGTLPEAELAAAIPGWRGCAAELGADAPFLAAE